MRSLVFSDFDAFADIVRDVDALMLLQNPARRRWKIKQTNFAGIDIQVGQVGSGTIVDGKSWSNGYLIYLPLSEGVEYTANGSVLEKKSFAVLEPGSEFCISTKAEHDWCTAFVPTTMLVRGDNHVAPSDSEKMTCRVTDGNPSLANSFRSIVSQIIIAAANSPHFESSPAATSAATEMLKLASIIVGERPVNEPDSGGRPRAPRQEIIRCSKELLDERAGEPILVSDLATTVGVSERTLRAAFNEYFGVGPVRYLQLRQLHQVHRTLRAADPKTASVSDAMIQHGAWEFSRFAARYRRLFGELPSATLRANAP